MIRLRLERLGIDRASFIEELGRAGIGTSVHWMPLHLHPYYQERFGLDASDFPVASAEWERMVSLPLYPTMSYAEQDRVADAIRTVIARSARARVA